MRGLQAILPKMCFQTNGNIRYNFVVIMNIIIGKSFGSADFLEFAAEAGLYKAHAECVDYKPSCQKCASKPTGIFAIISFPWFPCLPWIKMKTRTIMQLDLRLWTFGHWTKKN
jgi:hypothetical protein